MEQQYDATILGGGLAGLLLSLQLKQQDPDIKVLVLEMRDGKAPEAAFKIGESSVELGTHYMREVLNLKDYLDEKQLPKHGLRFFISPKHKNEIHRRVELGPKKFLPVPSHQIDRGIFENDLIDMSRELGNTVLQGARVQDVQISDPTHLVTYSKDGESQTVTTRWVVDATGRASFMKRKLGFAEQYPHNVNSTWFRVDFKVDIDEWSDDKEWHSHVENGLRYLSTVHLMDKGYWVWIIPLVGDRTSIGIVADEEMHPFKTYNTLDKSLDWLAENEPQLYSHLEGKEGSVMDFLMMKHFAYASKETYSTDRWTVVGEAGLFGDPFYSPGTDFISLANTFTGDLILRDLANEDVHFRTKFYAQVIRALYDNWMPLYRDQYELWGSTQIMVAKIFWDWGAYWSINTLLFTNNGLTDLDLMRELVTGPTSFLQRYGELSAQMQRLFKDMLPYDTADLTDRYTDPFDLDYLRKFQEDIVEKQYSKQELRRKLFENLVIIEKVAAETYRLFSNLAHGTSLSIEVDPYTMSLRGAERTSENSKLLPRDAQIAQQMQAMWLYPFEVEEFA
ncbi:MAG: FAD-dependent monooxygenase [Flavobacteriales bacterium]|nr:FAD-dependent monooxygenase [Flavobacteriales bacterium]